MKKSILFILIFFIGIVVWSDSEHGAWYKHDANWKQNIREVLGKNFSRPVLVEFGKFWCAGYQSFAHKTLESPKFIEFAQRHLELISINPIESKKLTEYYNINILPTYIVIDKYGNEIDRIENYADAEKFVENIKKIIYSDNSFLDLKRKFSLGNLSFKDHIILGEKYFERKMFSEAENVLEKVLFEDENNFKANLIMGHISLIGQNMVKSDYFYNNASKDGKRKGEVYYFAGLNAYMNRFHKEASVSLGSFAQFYKDKKNKPDFYFNGYYYLVLSNLFAEDFAKSEQALAEAENLFPEKKSQLGQLKILLWNAKKKSESLKHGDEHYHEGCGGATAQ
jgi:thiol-disulfide isomerase/thioredoxin